MLCVLCCVVLCCVVLCCIVLYCVVVWCGEMWFILLYDDVNGLMIYPLILYYIISYDLKQYGKL